jgi:hypothetical protein
MTKIITALNSCNFHRCKSYFHSVYVIELKYFEHGYLSLEALFQVFQGLSLGTSIV